MEFINVKLSDIGEVVGGATPSTKNPDNYDGNIAWITPKDLAGYNKVYISKGERNITEMGFKSCSTKILPKNSVLFSSRAPIGYVAISANDLCTNQGFKSIIPNDKIDYKFLYYLLKHNKDYIASKGSGSTFKEVSGSVMKGIELSIPKNINDQKKISKVLFDIDKKIELNNEINNNLLQLCKTNYLRIIEENSVEISLSELMDYQGGSQPPASEFQKEKNEDNIRFVQIRDFETDSYICYIPNSNKNKLCNKDDILIARYGASLGRICYGLSGAYNVALAKVLPKKAEYKELLRVILESDDFYNYINQVGQRSAQAGFNAGDIAGYTVIIPNENGLKIFNSISKNIIDKRLLMIEENRKLSELRDTLLPKLMNGEIDLDNIEI